MLLLKTELGYINVDKIARIFHMRGDVEWVLTAEYAQAYDGEDLGYIPYAKFHIDEFEKTFGYPFDHGCHDPFVENEVLRKD